MVLLGRASAFKRGFITFSGSNKQPDASVTGSMHPATYQSTEGFITEEMHKLNGGRIGTTVT